MVYQLGHLSVFTLVFFQEDAFVSGNCVFEFNPVTLRVTIALQELAKLY